MATLWKFEDFSVTHNLREINLGQSKSPKSTVFAIIGAPFWVNFSLQKMQKVMKNKNSEPLSEKMTVFGSQKSETLSSRKI